MRRMPPILAAALAAGLSAATTASAEDFTLSSPDLASGVFDEKFTMNGFGCTGGNVSPELVWSGVPEGTRSLSLQVHDADAPTGAGFWHWAVYNIPATATGLAQGAGNAPETLPAPAYGGNTDLMDTGVTGVNGNYAGPCPPVGHGPHHYTFTLYALAVDDVQAAGGIPKSGTASIYSFVLNYGVGPGLLGKASFTATYER